MDEKRYKTLWISRTADKDMCQTCDEALNLWADKGWRLHSFQAIETAAYYAAHMVLILVNDNV